MIAVAVVAVVLGVVAWFRKLLADDQELALTNVILAFVVVGSVIALGKALALSISSRTHPFVDNLKEPHRR
jgi:hypothetical protein